MLYPTQVIRNLKSKLYYYRSTLELVRSSYMELYAQLAASQRAYTELHTKHENLQAQLKELKK